MANAAQPLSDSDITDVAQMPRLASLNFFAPSGQNKSVVAPQHRR
jgi:hypothetical protein